jgi:guanylate kinase
MKNYLNEKGMSPSDKRLVVVSGPSGVGKSALLKEILKKYRDKIEFSVSYTSRPIREGETEGVDYHFVDKTEFEKGIADNLFLEWARVHDNYYATSRQKVEEIINKGKDCLLDIDVQGASNLMKNNVNAVYIFIAPPDIDTLKKRLLKRNTDSIETIEKRIKNAEKEMDSKDKYHYIVINDDFNRALKELEKIIFN